MLFHQTVDHRHTESGSLSGWLRSEERIEQLRERGLVHTAPSVAHRHTDEVTLSAPWVRRAERLVQRDVAHSNPKHATVRHRVPRVGREIEHDLFDRGRIDPHEPDRFRSVDLDAGALTEQSLEQARKIAHHLPQVQQPRQDVRLTREAEELLDHLRPALRRATELLEILACIRAIRRNVVRDQIGGGHNDGEDVIEVVGDTRGELAHGLPLLNLA